MVRLTEWTGENWIPVQERIKGKIVGYKDCMNKLAAYEDTGLTPEEIINSRLQTGWILITEMVPGNSDAVLVTDGNFVYTDVYDDGEFELYDGIIAWMPLPSPYQNKLKK